MPPSPSLLVRISLALLLSLVASSLPRPASAQAKFTFDMHGYYRARGVMFGNLYDDEHPSLNGSNLTLPVDQPELTTYLVQRGRLEPEIRLGSSLVVKSQIDLLDNVVWGDNENITATPLFAADPSTTQADGTVVDSIKVKRLWAEWQFMFGSIRVGRQGSQWGAGILANDGNGFDEDFGDNNFGSTYDRVMFVTKPLELARGLYGLASGKSLKPKEFGLIVGVGFDKLVESSQVSYYTRFDDTKGFYQKDPTTGEYIESSRYSPIWLSDQGDDVSEMVYVLALKRDNMPVGKKGSDIMDLMVGTYAVNRWQKETDSKVWILDGYLNWKWRTFFVQTEGYWITGKTKAIGAAGSTRDDQDCSEELAEGGFADSETNHDDCKEANIKGFVFRGGYEDPLLTGLFEMGYASGDNDLRDEDFTGRALHGDHGVGLVLYRQVLAAKTAQAFVGDPDYKGLWSNGGVYNSFYINPRVKFRPTSFLELRLGVLTAWVDRVDGAIIPYLSEEERNTYVGACEDKESDDPYPNACDGQVSYDRNLGVELDFGIHMTWAEEHVLVGIEGGWLHAGKRLGLTAGYAETDPNDGKDGDEDLTALDEDPGIASRLNNPWTLQGRFAVVF